MHIQKNIRKYKINPYKITATPHQHERKEDPTDLRPDMIDRKSEDKSEQKETEARTSGRHRRHPITRKDDFLWSTGP
jgi:hypothetical protein